MSSCQQQKILSYVNNYFAFIRLTCQQEQGAFTRATQIYFFSLNKINLKILDLNFLRSHLWKPMKKVITFFKFDSQEWLQGTNLVHYIYLFIPQPWLGCCIQKRICKQVYLQLSAASTVDGSNICSSWRPDLGGRLANIVGQIDCFPGDKCCRCGRISFTAVYEKWLDQTWDWTRCHGKF